MPKQELVEKLEEVRPACSVCGEPARERACGGWDDHCSDACAFEEMKRLFVQPPPGTSGEADGR
jgi:hypothetical protein